MSIGFDLATCLLGHLLIQYMIYTVSMNIARRRHVKEIGPTCFSGLYSTPSFYNRYHLIFHKSQLTRQFQLSSTAQLVLKYISPVCIKPQS